MQSHTLSIFHPEMNVNDLRLFKWLSLCFVLNWHDGTFKVHVMSLHRNVKLSVHRHLQTQEPLSLDFYWGLYQVTENKLAWIRCPFGWEHTEVQHQLWSWTSSCWWTQREMHYIPGHFIMAGSAPMGFIVQMRFKPGNFLIHSSVRHSPPMELLASTLWKWVLQWILYLLMWINMEIIILLEDKCKHIPLN